MCLGGHGRRGGGKAGFRGRWPAQRESQPCGLAAPGGDEQAQCSEFSVTNAAEHKGLGQQVEDAGVWNSEL